MDRLVHIALSYDDPLIDYKELVFVGDFNFNYIDSKCFEICANGMNLLNIPPLPPLPTHRAGNTLDHVTLS